jgi:hypothetical protein
LLPEIFCPPLWSPLPFLEFISEATNSAFLLIFHSNSLESVGVCRMDVKAALVS